MSNLDFTPQKKVSWGAENANSWLWSLAKWCWNAEYQNELRKSSKLSHQKKEKPTLIHIISKTRHFFWFDLLIDERKVMIGFFCVHKPIEWPPFPHPGIKEGPTGALQQALHRDSILDVKMFRGHRPVWWSERNVPEAGLLTHEGSVLHQPEGSLCACSRL